MILAFISVSLSSWVISFNLKCRHGFRWILFFSFIRCFPLFGFVVFCSSLCETCEICARQCKWVVIFRILVVVGSNKVVKWCSSVWSRFQVCSSARAAHWMAAGLQLPLSSVWSSSRVEVSSAWSSTKVTEELWPWSVSLQAALFFSLSCPLSSLSPSSHNKV